ncbi:MAG: hypothetical protein NC212_07745 [Staphylococcus sp.]|nr:hypothetical protein [Staphylococcus sp.]
MKPRTFSEYLSQAITDSYNARQNLKRLSWQIIVAAIITGLATKSWLWFAITFAGLIVAMRIPYLGGLLCIALGAIIGIAAGMLFGALGGAACGWIIGILVGISMIIGNLNGRQA